MEKITKREKLTDLERQSMESFIGKCVIKNVVFPPMQIGRQGYTIQELYHMGNTSNLGNYADFLEKQAGNVSRAQRALGVTEKRISNTDITYKVSAEICDLIIKDKLYNEYLENVKQRKNELIEQIAAAKTPTELRQEAEAELAALEV